MGGATVLEQAAVGKLREKKINDDLKVIETPEPFKFNIHVEGEKHYIVHFVNPSVFGQEFATLGKGPNHFTTKKDKETNSYFFNDEQLRNIVTGVEPVPTEGKMASSMTQAVTPSPCTGPIIIPPRVWDK